VAIPIRPRSGDPLLIRCRFPTDLVSPSNHDLWFGQKKSEKAKPLPFSNDLAIVGTD
jgi:hypothetical protein